MGRDCRIVHLDSNKKVSRFCAGVFEQMGISYSNNPACIGNSELLIVNSDNLKIAQSAREKGYNGNVVLHTADPSISYGDYKVTGVDEILRKPTSKKEMRSEIEKALLKHTAEKARVLAVEDDASTRLLLEEALVAWGYTPVTTAKAEQGLEELPSVHLVISDVIQPGSRGGYWLLEKTRERYDKTQLPFVFLSAADEFDMGRCAGASKLFYKPIRSMAVFHEEIKSLLPADLKE